MLNIYQFTLEETKVLLRSILIMAAMVENEVETNNPEDANHVQEEESCKSPK